MGKAIHPIAHHPFVATLMGYMHSMSAEDPQMADAAAYTAQSVTKYCPA